MRAWQTKLGSRDQCGSLLSLAWLMAKELEPLLYSTKKPDVTSYTMVPFILPLSRLHEIAWQHQPATAMGCHIENLTEGQRGAAVDLQCAFCMAIESAEDQAEAYRDQRTREENELRQLEFNDDCENYQERLDAYLESKAATDELYEDDNINENMGSILATWSAEGKIPPLKLVESVDEEELHSAVRCGFYEHSQRGHDGYCKSHLCPLATFFRRNGFGRVHRAVLEEDQYEFMEDHYRDEIHSIEMVGAAAPHGFFAGVYILPRSC